MPSSTGPEGLPAPPDHVGVGTVTDFSGRALAGKILLIDGAASEDGASRAAKAGAAGQIHVSPTRCAFPHATGDPAAGAVRAAESPLQAMLTKVRARRTTSRTEITRSA
jgi:hypothetical protein